MPPQPAVHAEALGASLASAAADMQAALVAVSSLTSTTMQTPSQPQQRSGMGPDALLCLNTTSMVSLAKLPCAWVCLCQVHTSLSRFASSVEGHPYRHAEPLQPAQPASGGGDSSHSTDSTSISRGGSGGDGQHGAGSHQADASSTIAGLAPVPAAPALTSASSKPAASPTGHCDAATSTTAFGSSRAVQPARVAPASGSAAAQPGSHRQRSIPPTASAGSVQDPSMGDASEASSGAPSDGPEGRVLHELWGDRGR